MDTPASTAAVDIASKFTDNANKALVVLIDKVTSGIDQATSFLVAQVPDVIHQLLVYNFVASLVVFTLGFLGLIFWPYGMRVLYKKTKQVLPARDRSNFDQSDYGTLLVVAALIGMVLSIITMLIHLEWIEIWLAPKIWLIEYATQLIKMASGK